MGQPSENTYQDVIRAMSQLDAYPEAPTSVQIVQTAVSIVFLTDFHAYKVKKPVDFGFINYSTLNKREHYCNEELRVNKLLSGGIHLGVVPILRDKEGRISMTGEGSVIEYAIKMTRLPQEAMMSNVLKNGNIEEKNVMKVAEILCNFYQRSATNDKINKFGSADFIEYLTVSGIQRILALDVLEEREEVNKMLLRTKKWIEKNGDLIEKRIKDNYVREYHGDLHLDNIFVVDGSIHIFDAIEFNDEFRYGDVAGDLAFFVMELEFYQRHDLAEGFVRHYIKHSEDRDLMLVINFYKRYRALVKVYVNCLKLLDANLSLEEKTACKELMKKYIQLAATYDL